MELAPGSADACFDLSTHQASSGQVEAAVEQAKQTLARNPLNAFWHDWLAWYLGGLGRLDEAEAAARKSVMLSPQQPLSYRELTYIEVLKSDAAAALAAAQQVPSGRNRDIAIAWALQMSPDHAAADAALKNLIAGHEGDSSYQIAEVYALRKDPDNLFKWLDRAWANRDDAIQYLLYDPIILRYKDDPRFAGLLPEGRPAHHDRREGHAVSDKSSFFAELNSGSSTFSNTFLDTNGLGADVYYHPSISAVCWVLGLTI